MSSLDSCVLELPVAEAAATPMRRQILIVEDDHAQAEVLTHRFHKQGFVCRVTHGGREALTLASRHQPDLIVLDMCLPDIDGLQISHQLSNDAQTWTIPIILLSGADNPDIIRRARAAGCQYFLRKPYDPNALLLLAEAALKER